MPQPSATRHLIDRPHRRAFWRPRGLSRASVLRCIAANLAQHKPAAPSSDTGTKPPSG